MISVVLLNFFVLLPVLRLKVFFFDSISVAVGSKRKFWNPRKWFKRKQKSTDDGNTGEVLEQAKDALRSRSTSELSIAEEQTRRR